MVLILEHRDGKLLITGNTFDFKGLLRNVGGAWEPKAKGWAFPPHREADVLQVLQREKLLFEDKRVAGVSALASAVSQSQASSSTRKKSSGLIVMEAEDVKAKSRAATTSRSNVIRTPAAGRVRPRSRTPPRVAAPTPPQLRLNDRTVRERTAILASAIPAERSQETSTSEDVARAISLCEQLSNAAEAVATAAETSEALQRALAKVEAVMKAADQLSAEALEVGGLVREAARIAFSRKSATLLRRAARKAMTRWVQSRAEAAACEVLDAHEQ